MKCNQCNEGEIMYVRGVGEVCDNYKCEHLSTSFLTMTLVVVGTISAIVSGILKLQGLI